MSESQTTTDILVMVSFGVPATISVFFIMAMIARFMSLRSDITAKKMNFNFSLLFRISLLGCEMGICIQIYRSLIVAEISSLFLVTYYDSFYSYKDARAFLIFINVSAITMQIILMIYEYNKRVPLFYAHKLYWLANLLALTGICIMLVEYQTQSFGNYAIIIIRMIIYSTLLIFSVFIRKQDIAEFEDLQFFRSTVPDVDTNNSEYSRHRMSTINYGDSKIFKIEVRRRWNVINDQIQLIMEIQMIGSEKKYKCKRMLQELLELHPIILNECSEYLEQNPSDLIELNSIIEQVRESQEINLVSCVQKYLGTLNAKLDFACNALLDFIQLPQSEKSLIDEFRQQTVYQQQTKSSVIKKKDVMHYKWDVQTEFLPYFDVRIIDFQNQGNFVQYNVQIKFKNEQWQILRRFTDFYELNETLRQFLQLKGMPPLPQKKIIKLSEEEIEERKMELEINIKNLLNDRIYHHYSLYKFAQLTKEQEDELKSLQQQIANDSVGVQKLQIQGMGFGETDNIMRYQFQVSCGAFKMQIQKRFSQFDELHQVLRVRFNGLPSLPTKYTPLQQQIAPSQRSFNLTQYLQALIKVPCIGESIHFRQFLEIKKFTNHPSRGESRKSSSLQDLELVFNKLDQENHRDSQKLEQLKIAW